MGIFDSGEIEKELEQLKAQMRNLNWAKRNNQASPPNPKYTPPTSESKTKRAQEIDEELEWLKAQMRNPNWAKRNNQASPPNPKYTPPKNDFKSKRAQEIDEELEQLKAQMRNPQNHANTKYNPPVSEQNKVFYEILEINPGASQNEIKQAYKRLAKKWHPDGFFNEPQLQLQAQEKCRKIIEAYKKLSAC